MRYIVVALILVFLCPHALLAQNAFDPFQSGQNNPTRPDRGTDFKPMTIERNRSAAANTANASLYQPRLNSDFDRQRFEECQAQAQAAGMDVRQLRNATAFINVPYRDRNCTRYVVEKLFAGMDFAMANDPEALAEFNRNPQAQTRYEELKKAFLILNRDSAQTNPSANNAPTSPVFNPMSMNNNPNPRGGNLLGSQNEAAQDLFIPRPNVPIEWWAQDYYFDDINSARAKAAQRQAIFNRQPPGAQANPLQNVMQQAEQAEQQRLNSRGPSRVRPQNQSPFR
jgi:hypothetical protein